MYYILHFCIIEILLQSIISDIMISVRKAVGSMSMIGYYDGTAVRVNEPLQIRKYYMTRRRSFYENTFFYIMQYDSSGRQEKQRAA